jgi:hypothetical protein
MKSAVSGIKPPHNGIQSKEFGVDREREGDIALRLVLFKMRPLLHQLHDVSAVHLDYFVYVDVRQARGDKYLDH